MVSSPVFNFNQYFLMRYTSSFSHDDHERYDAGYYGEYGNIGVKEAYGYDIGGH